MSRIKFERVKKLIEGEFENLPTAWPEHFPPVCLALMQAPPEGKDRTDADVWQSCIESALECGELDNTPRQYLLSPILWDVVRDWSEQLIPCTRPSITATAFAAWLAAQGETPSIHIQAWFDAVGVAGAGAQDEPAESIEQRNSRWLAQLEVAKNGTSPPSDTAVYQQIEAAEGVGWETVKKGVSKAKKDLAEKYREGNVKPLTRGKKGKPELSNVWRHRMGK